MATQTDLWGDIQPLAVRTPVSILRQQAALLGNKTQNMVEAKVRSVVEAGEFYHSFNLVVPSLDSYTYRLFAVHHGPELYPVTFSRGEELRTEEEFVEWLRKRLSSDETRKIVGSLLAQASGQIAVIQTD
jgi:hypothetical protein